MKLISTQSPEVVKTLLDGNVFHCDPMKSEYLENELAGKESPNFLHAYDFISEQMKRKIGEPPKGVKYPIWAWARVGFMPKFPKPNSKRWRDIITCPGYYDAVLYLEVPDDQVLLSDFNRFHEVLNNFPILDAKSEEELDATYSRYEKLPYEDKNRMKLRSWEKIFDVEPYRTKFETRGEFVQATFWELKPEYVKSIVLSDRRGEKEFDEDDDEEEYDS